MTASPALDPEVMEQAVEDAAEVLCLADDSMYHHDRTDDFPCSTCKTTTQAIITAALPEVIEPFQIEVAELREALGSRTREVDRCIRELRRIDARLVEAFTTKEHHKVVKFGLPFCSCGLDLQGDDGCAGDVWIEHRLNALPAVIAAAEARGAARALEDAAAEQRHLSTGPCALGSRAVQFKRIIFATWLDDRAATYRKADR